MTTEHPITPPPELVQQWRNLPEYVSQLQTMSMLTITTEKLQDIATQAARWGADQELEACCEWVSQWCCMVGDSRPEIGLRSFRRPKPPSLKEQALEELGQISIGPELGITYSALETIRRALEQLDD
jgi:hypothetical protein